jgi:hypothetical protein
MCNKHIEAKTMKKISILIIGFLILTSLFIFSDNVYADIGDVTLTNWDDGVINNHSYSNTDLYMENAVETATCYTYVVASYIHSDPLMIKHNTIDSPTNTDQGSNTAYINITGSHPYIGSLDVYLKFNYYPGSIMNTQSSSYIYFYNGSDSLFYIRMHGFTNSYLRIYITTSSGTTTIYDGAYNSAPIFRMEVLHNFSNYMTWNFYNETNVLVETIEDGTLSSNVWSTFDSIKLTATETGTNGAYTYVNIDDIIINTEREIEEGSYTDSNMYIRLWDYETGERLAFSHEQTLMVHIHM